MDICSGLATAGLPYEPDAMESMLRVDLLPLRHVLMLVGDRSAHVWRMRASSRALFMEASSR